MIAKKPTTVALVSFATLLTVFYYLHDYRPCQDGRVTPPRREYKARGNVDSVSYDRNLPIIFIGGFPRSGTTLMRAMLDAHPHVRCGEETRVIPRVLGMRNQWKRSDKENKRLKEAGLTDEVLDSALTAFILEIIVKHGEPASRLCNKDPFTLKSGVYLSTLFPKAKFLFMVRDGRAVVNSIISRQVTITGFDLTNQSSCLSKWSKSVEHMYHECTQIGNRRCLPVFYEQLVIQPRKWMQKILTFLELPWREAVLHHEDYIEKPGGIALSKTEKSTDQIVKPVNTDALSKWVGKFPPKIVNNMENIAPMLQKLGYDPGANPPKYGQPDQSKATERQRMESNKLYSS